jgi:RimJ/RimL family protein N-acetyltransferase
MSHALETWELLRVELKTDVLNQKCGHAILRIGGAREGIFRKHTITGNGRIRDDVYFSILDNECPTVKRSLEAKRSAHR